MNGQQASFGHIWSESTHKAQILPACTQLIQSMVRSGGQRFRGYGLVVGRGEKSILKVPAQALSGWCPVGMAYITQKKQAELEPLGACHEG